MLILTKIFRQPWFIFILLGFVFLPTINALHISVYYYPWYNGISNNRVLRNTLEPRQPPVLGSYDSDDPDVVSRHIEWSEEYGVDNWITSWWGDGTKTDNMLRNGVVPLLNKSNLTYCLFFETTGIIGFGDVSGSNINEMRIQVAYMARNHFNQPSYYKIDGKPVVYMYVTRALSGNYTEGFEAMRQGARDEGYEIYLVGDENYWGNLNEDRTSSFDAVSPYNMHGPAQYDGWPLEVDLFKDVKEQYLKDKEIAANLGVDFIPNCMPGFNDRAQRLGDDHYIIPRRVLPDSGHTSTFRHFFDVALSTMDTSLQSITINSWNEWMEDSNIEPVERTGSTTNDDNGNRYTLGYEYVGYGEDHLQVIRDKREEWNASQIDTTTEISGIRNTRENPELNPFTLYSQGKRVGFNVAFSVKKIHIHSLSGTDIGNFLTNNNEFDMDRIPGNKNSLTKGIYLVQFEGDGRKHSVKYLK